ncbi:MAG: hypothetical protein JKY37_08455 [Nannocystaceae bacterium]|nr:hypothetical protein [Nannocystaceae bacterium]
MSSAPQAVPAPAQVKTLTFTTLRGFLLEHFDAEANRRIRGELDLQTRTLLDEAEPGAWALELQMQALMRAVYEQVLRRDDDAYLEFARALAAVGITRFMKIFLSLASARFVLRRIPVVWDRLRRNAGQVTTELAPGVVRIRYQNFPFFGDKLYRLLSIANCQALVFAATNRIPPARVVEYSDDSLLLEFDLEL